MALKRINTGTSKIASGQLASLPSAISVTFPQWMTDKYQELVAAQNAINSFSSEVVRALSTLATASTESSTEQSASSNPSTEDGTENDDAIKQVVTQVEAIKASIETLVTSLAAQQDSSSSLTSSVATIGASVKSLSDSVEQVAKQSDTAASAYDSISEQLAALSTSISTESIARAQGNTTLSSQLEAEIARAQKIEDGKEEKITGIAAQALSGHRAMTYDAEGLVTYAQPGDVVAGITEHAYGEGEPVTMRNSGAIAESSWTWTPGGTVFLAADGVLTQVVPQSGYVTEIGRARSATSLLLQITESIQMGA